MKNLASLAVASLLAAGLVGCATQDGGTTTDVTQSMLLGTWMGNMGGKTVQLSFAGDGTINETFFDTNDDVQGTFSLEGSTLTLVVRGASVSHDVVFVDNELVFDSGDHFQPLSGCGGPESDGI